MFQYNDNQIMITIEPTLKTVCMTNTPQTTEEQWNFNNMKKYIFTKADTNNITLHIESQ
jgi:hypothetical protein